MAGLFRHIARTANFLGLSALAVTLLASGVCAQTGSTPLTGRVSPKANTAPHASDTKVSAQPVDPRINTTEIANRLDLELGINLQATTTGWQRELDQIQTELGRPRLRYSELNEFRDRLQQVRSQVDDTWGRLQPRLKADKAQVNLLGPAPAADQPPEPEQTALARAESNYHLSLLSGGKAAVDSTNLCIENSTERDSGHPPKEFYFHSVPTDPRGLRLRDLGKTTKICAIGAPQSPRLDHELVARCSGS